MAKMPVLTPAPAPFRNSRLASLGDAIVALTSRGEVGESIDALYRLFRDQFGKHEIDAALDTLGDAGAVWFMSVGPQVRVVAAKE